MSDQMRLRQSASAERIRAGAERYRRYQREMRSGKAPTGAGPRPREFDESGFPIAQRNPSFAERVARLLNPV